MKREGFKKVVSILTICILILSQGICGFAAADPKENTEIQNLTEGWSDSDSKGAASMDFSEIDIYDTSHKKVKWISYDPSDRMVATTVWAAEKAKANVDKHISFDLYIYDNTIPYEIRFCDGEKKAGKVLGQININFLGTAENKPMTIVNSDAKISIGSKTYEDETALVLENQKWHKVEVIFSEGRSTYYINGQNIGSSTHEGTYFTSYQIVARKGNYAESVTEKSGIYLDNFKSVVYGDVAQFYGKASVEGGNINVEFSESISSTYTSGFSGVKVYNTKTGAQVSTETPTLSGTILTIPVNETLATATEYMIDFPNKPTGISGKKLYSNVYFYVAGVNSAKQSSEDFDDYQTLTDNSTKILAANTSWFSGKINIKDLTSETDTVDKAHKNVVFTKSSADDNENLRFGIKSSKAIDTTKGEASVEFDIKLPNHEYRYLVMQPYSDVNGKTEKDLVTAGSHNDDDKAMSGLNNQFATFVVMGKSGTDYAGTYNEGNPYIVFNTGDNKVYIDKLPTAEDVKTVSLAKDDWHTIKITIDNTKSEQNYTVVKLYVDGVHKATNTASVGGADVTETLKGIRFAMRTYNNSKELIWVDNLKFTYFEDEETVVEKIRIYDLKNENYGPMATDVPSSAECAEIKLTKATPQADDAVVTLSDGTNTITSNVTLSADSTVLTAIFDDMLENNKEYTLTVSGTGFSSSSVKFNTTESSELVIHNLRITDSNGDVISGKPSTAGTYYVKAKIINSTNTSQDALILGAVYNGKCMKDVNFEEITVGARSKTTEISLPIKVESIEDVAVSAMTWENFTNCKPILDAIDF